MKNEEKLALIERFKQHAGVKEILLSDIGYMQGMSGNGLTTEKEMRTPGLILVSWLYPPISSLS